MRTFLLLITIFNLSIRPVWSVTNPISQIQNYELTLRALTSLRQIHEMSTDQTIKEIAEAATIDPKLVRHYEEVLKNASLELIKESIALKNSKVESKKIWKMLNSEIDWSKVSKIFIKQVKQLKAFGKMHGFGLLGAAVLTNILQIIVPPILFTIAGPIPSALSFIALGNGPTVFYYQAATFFNNQRKLRKFFKGKDNHEKFKTVMRKVYETLSLDTLDDLIVPLSHPTLQKYGLKLSDESILNKSLRAVGFRKNTLNLKKLNQFIQDQQIIDPLFELIKESRNLKDSQKSFLTLIHLNSVMTPSEASVFHKSFSRYMVSNTLPNKSDDLVRWVEDMVLKAKTPRDVLELIDGIPADAKPMEVVYLWDRVVMPELAKRDKVFGMFQFRRLRENLPSIQSEIYLNKRERMSFQMKFFIKRYIKNAMVRQNKDCFQTHNQVLSNLINQSSALTP